MENNQLETSSQVEDDGMPLEAEVPVIGELDADIQVLYKSMEYLETPSLLMDDQTKVVAFNLAGKIHLQKRGRLLQRRLDQIFPTIRWAEILKVVRDSRSVVSEQINFPIVRGLSKKMQAYHCVFMPLRLGGGLYTMLQLLPIHSSPTTTAMPESVVVKLRDPLTIILGHLEMLVGKDGLAPKEIDYHLQKIARHAHNISSIIKMN